MSYPPEYATHYYMRGRRPFLNLSDLAEPRLSEVVNELSELRNTSHQRLFGRDYMVLRRPTEPSPLPLVAAPAHPAPDL